MSFVSLHLSKQVHVFSHLSFRIVRNGSPLVLTPSVCSDDSGFFFLMATRKKAKKVYSSGHPEE